MLENPNDKKHVIDNGLLGSDLGLEIKFNNYKLSPSELGVFLYSVFPGLRKFQDTRRKINGIKNPHYGHYFNSLKRKE